MRPVKRRRSQLVSRISSRYPDFVEEVSIGTEGRCCARIATIEPVLALFCQSTQQASPDRVGITDAISDPSGGARPGSNPVHHLTKKPSLTFHAPVERPLLRFHGPLE